MSVDIANLEPPVKVDWQTFKNTANSPVLQKYDIQKKQSIDSDMQNILKPQNDSLELSNNYLNYTLRSALEESAKANQADSVVSNLIDYLKQLKKAAEEAASGKLNEVDNYKIQDDFNKIKSNLNELLKQTDINGTKFIENLNPESNNSQFIENLNIDSAKNTEKTIEELDDSLYYAQNKRNEINNNKANANETLASLLSSDTIDENANFKILNSTQALTETVSIGDIILGNNRDASAAQANTRYDNYLNLLRASFIANEQQNQKQE